MAARSRGADSSPSQDEAATQQASLGPPVRGDWLLLSDAESLNPLTSNDATASEVLSFVMSSLTATHPKTFAQIPVLAAELPTVSADHLTYTFKLRKDATFSDGTSVTVDDVLFSVKAIKNPEVKAPFLRNYYTSLVDARAIDDSTIEFRCSEPYFRNDVVLGGISVLPKHFYDPRGELDDISVADLAGWDAIAPEKKEKAVRFAQSFNADFHRRVLGAGAYVLMILRATCDGRARCQPPRRSGRRAHAARRRLGGPRLLPRDRQPRRRP